MITKDIDVPALKARVTRIITDPKSEWNVIAAESTTPQQLYMGYVVPLAAIPPLASLIGQSIIGVTMPFVGTVRAPLTTMLSYAIVSYVFSLALVYIAAIAVSRLAPTFESRSDDRQALKLVAYSFTPSWIAGVLLIIPTLGALTALGGLYAIYLFYVGLPVMMKTPPERVLPYLVIAAVVVILLAFVTAIVVGSITGVASLTTLA